MALELKAGQDKSRAAAERRSVTSEQQTLMGLEALSAFFALVFNSHSTGHQSSVLLKRDQGREEQERQEFHEIPQDKCQFLPLQGTNLSKDTSWGLPGEEQHHGKGLGGQGTGQRATLCPGCKGGQQHPGLCEQVPGHEMEAGHNPEYCIQILNPKPREDVTIWSGFGKGCQDGWGPEYFTCEERLGELGLSSLGQGRLKGIS